MTDHNPHPGVAAATRHAEYVALRTKAQGLKIRAASLRREAKAAALTVDAHKLRLDAKAASNEARELLTLAKAVKADVESSIQAAAQLLTSRMPPDYSHWGVVKTRAYVKVLGVVSAQSKRSSPNLALATHGIGLLLSHTTWSESVLSQLAAITTMPKALP
ncbi:MAG: hypothetical protein QE485_10820 [Acidovorax sp.]|uniref:hypothetical protein n=1 Tax=Acidovorax sp. TaxID=1872122 RepID=UPI002613A404|nr:hypothetical protein [Acidovorax sp.]MDH4417708.1 hypothetical protein [Acidovorax sp.]